MEYYVEVSRLVDSAVAGNQTNSINLTRKLIDALKNNGDFVAAAGLEKKLATVQSSPIKSQGLFEKPVPVEKDNRFALADRIFPSPDESKVFLSAAKSEEIKSFLTYILKQERLREVGIPANPSLLLYGMPGTGKSQLANYIASELNLPLVIARSDALISSYLGSTSKNIRSLLEYASTEPCVLFLDEFDSIAKARDDKNEIGELKRVVVSLLQNIDSLNNTVLVAATNHPHLLDPAVWRRFHYKMELGLPDLDVRRNLIHNILNNFIDNDCDIMILAKLTSDKTGAEIKMVIHEYLRFIIVNDLDFDLGDICRRILKDKYTHLSFEPENKRQEIIWLHGCDNGLFTYRLLALIFDISLSYVGKILKGSGK
ncbi:TPA: ATP-binding protein [Vibrio cholerae]|nr:ATP-binding protein [Vibrio cholerae]